MKKNNLNEEEILKIKNIEKIAKCPYCEKIGTLIYADRLNIYTFQCINCGKYSEHRVKMQ